MAVEGPSPPSNNKGINNPKGVSSAGAGGGLAAWWAQVRSQHGPTVQAHVVNVKAKAKGIKWSMPVDVKVDFVRPMMETIREVAFNARQAFYTLPPHVQQAAPLAGVALGSGLLVFLVQQRRVNYHVSSNPCTLNSLDEDNAYIPLICSTFLAILSPFCVLGLQRRQGADLTLQVNTLRKEKEELLKRINLLKAKSGTPRTEVETRMAAAIAEATNAAAAAADAAARAATACIYQRPAHMNDTNNKGPMVQ